MELLVEMQFIENIWFFLSVLTLLVIVVTWIWLVVRAFQEHWLWGIATVVMPASGTLFAVLHWDRTRRPMLIGLVATAAFFIELLVARAYQAIS